MGAWIEGCVADSRRYVPGRSADQVKLVGALVLPATAGATSVANDCTRGPWTGGVAPDASVVHGTPGKELAINQETHPCAFEWSGLVVVVRCDRLPSPPPTCPTIMIDVGMGFTGVVPVPVSKDEYR